MPLRCRRASMASASAYSWLGPPRPCPCSVTVSSPPERIDGPAALCAHLAGKSGVFRGDLARLALQPVAEHDAFVAGLPPRPARREARRPAARQMRYSVSAKPDRPALASRWPDRRARVDTLPGNSSRYRATMARASASVVGSGTVGPEPITAGSSPGTSEIASVDDAAPEGTLREPAALDAREVLAHAY